MTSQKSFKPGDLVVCVDDTETLGKLEHGKTYKVIKSDAYFTFLEGLRDSNNGYYSGRFELVEETPKLHFKVGDVVECCGAEGVVEHVYENVTYKVQVSFKDENNKIAISHFTEDGRLFHFHKTPSLVLVSRPKKKVTKTVEKWINIYPSHAGGFYSDEKNADEYAQQNRIACVKLTGEYETESDDE